MKQVDVGKCQMVWECIRSSANRERRGEIVGAFDNAGSTGVWFYFPAALHIRRPH
jgi:hypothetical protein